MAKRHKCQECGQCKEDVGTGEMGGLCEECEESFIWCYVCQEWQRREEPSCRHLFYGSVWWNGAGACESDWDDCRESFYALCGLLAMIPRNTSYDQEWHHVRGWLGWREGLRHEETAAQDLPGEIARYLLRDNFWTFTHGFLLSVPDCDFCFEDPREYNSSFAELSGSWVRIWQRQCPEQYELASDGWAWLTSLECEKTKQANARTCQWVMEWRLARQRERMGKPA